MSGTEPMGLLPAKDSPRDLAFILRACGRANLGRTVAGPRNGAKALASVLGEGTPVDRRGRSLRKLIRLDLKRPKVDGFDGLRGGQRDPRSRRVRMVGLTASNQPSEIATSRHLGANRYAVKPLGCDGFAAKACELERYWALRNNSAPPQT